MLTFSYRLDRLARLDKALANGGLCVRDFAAREECSIRTVRRQLDKIRRDLGLPLKFDRSRGVWRYQRSGDSIFTRVVHTHCL